MASIHLSELLAFSPPVPVGTGFIGAACGAEHMDDARAWNIDSYCEWLTTARERGALAGSAWRRAAESPEVAHSFGLHFERICCALLRASRLLGFDTGCAPRDGDEALQASCILKEASTVAALWNSELQLAWPELSMTNLEVAARRALCIAHIHHIFTLPESALRAGLMRSVAAECGQLGCRAAAHIAEAEAMRCSAVAHSDVDQPEAALACAAKAEALAALAPPHIKAVYSSQHAALRATVDRMPDSLRGPRVPAQAFPAVALPDCCAHVT